MTARVRQALTKDPADEMIDAALLGGTSSGQLHPSWGGRPAAAKGGKQRTARAGAESRTARTARTARDAGKDTAAGSPAPRKDATSPAAKPKPKATGATKGSAAAKGTGAGAKPKKKKKKKKKRPAAADEEAAASSGNWFEIQTQRAQSQAQMTRSLMSMYESGDGYAFHPILLCHRLAGCAVPDVIPPLAWPRHSLHPLRFHCMLLHCNLIYLMRMFHMCCLIFTPTHL